MTPKSQYYTELIIKQWKGELSPGEEEELRSWQMAAESHQRLHETLNDGETMAILLQKMQQYDQSAMAKNIERELPELHLQLVNKPTRIAHRVHFLKTAWFRYAAAIILIFGIGAYLWNIQQKEKSLATQPVPVKDILPGGNKALLTLADGSTIALDSAVNGQLAIQQGSNVVKKDGQIIYDPTQQNATTVTYNTMSTPRGGTYQLTLPDGTKVWLNAASSITFPTAFINKERIVNITGEVYFEVIKNKEKPFIVKASTEDITVLGTSFNINAYPDEQHHKTSLLEGSVKISNVILKPGQAYMNGKVATTNLEQDLAWKNGYFKFIRADLPTVMRQLSRWYDIEVVYTGAVPFFDFKGELPKSLTLSQVLKILERMDVKFTVEGRKLIVSP